MWTPHTVVAGVSEAAEKFNPTTHFNLYGLGWFLGDYQGRKVVSHGGGLDGMISRVAMMPEENLGLVVLTNSETPLSTALSNKIFDVFLGVPKRDWSADYLARAKAGRERAAAEAKKVEDARVPDTRPSLPLAAYAGAYTGQMFGDARVSEGGRQTRPPPRALAQLRRRPRTLALRHLPIRWRDSIVYPFPRGFVTFTLDPRGRVEELKLDVPNPDSIQRVGFKKQ